MNDIVESLRKQLAELEENLRLIQEREAEHVLPSEIPLQLIKDKRKVEARITELRERLAEIAQAQLDADMDQLRARRDRADKARRRMRERQRVVNLRPLDVTHTFRDRVREAQALCKHLADGSVRLISVVGRAGMGKTALVSRVLGDLERGVLPVPGEERELSVDGILYLSARSTGLGLERIYADVGRMLGEPAASRLAARWTSDVPLITKAEYLLEVMRDGLYLILLDNLEDLLTEAGTIADEGLSLFVERCLVQPGGAQLIATSREQVKVAAAALRGARSILLREGLPEDEAIALLRDLDSQGELGLSDAPDDELRRAVQLTQGIPRALEILAGILHGDPTVSLPELLDDEHLFGEQVVEQLVAEGYQRLGENERRVIEALAVFDHPVEEIAIAYLLYPWFPGLDVRSCLRRLVRGYFVSVDRVAGEYSLHPLDREYAYSRVPADREGDEYTQRNLELRAASFYASIRKPEDEWESIDDLTPQLAEFEHRVRADEYEEACHVLDLIDPCLYRWGHYLRLVDMRTRLVGQLTDCGLQTDNLGALGRSSRALGRFARAIELYEQALGIARDVGDRRREGIQLSYLGTAYRVMGQIQRAVALSEEALAIARETGDRRAESAHLSSVGRGYRALGQIERAIECQEKALAIASELGDRHEEGTTLSSLGSNYRALGQIERAVGLYKQALSIAREIGDSRVEGFSLASLGSACRGLAQPEQAIEYYEQALAIARETGYRQGEESDLGDLGGAYYELGQIEKAIRFYEEALAIAREIGDHRGASHHLLGVGRALLTVGALSKAEMYCSQALALDIKETSYRVGLTLGIVRLHRQSLDAGDSFADAVARCRTRLDETSNLYRERYIFAAALIGQAVCDQRWAEESERIELLAPALAEYRKALEITSAKGVVQDAIRDLELIRGAGIEGLEPVFELLESAMA
jgi:tetratricopeptide (TPR) repeat protein